MKLHHYSVLLLACSFHSATSQIQITTHDVYTPGIYQMGRDQEGGFDIGTPGGNKVWDFTKLKNEIPYEFQLTDYASKDKDNNANYAKIDGIDTFQFVKRSEYSLHYIRPVTNFSEVDYYRLQYLQFPMMYNSKVADSFGFTYYYKGADFGVNKDSVRLIYKECLYTMVDAWGTLKLAHGDYNSLRIKSTIVSKMYMEGKSGSGPYEHVSGYDYDLTGTDYKWYANGQGTVLLSYSMEDDAMDFMVSASLAAPETKAVNNSLKFTNPMGDNWKLWNSGKDENLLQLFDGSGKLVSQHRLSANTDLTIPTSTLSEGLYYLESTNMQTGAKQGFKVIK
jgi:hypothetical protein